MSTPRSDTWMPLYVSDYLGDTTHLTTEQHGAYFLLLIGAWKRGGYLPVDARQLAAMAKLTPAGWRKHAPVLVPFFLHDGERLVHKRVLAEAQKAVGLVEQRSVAGKASAEARRRQREGNENPTGVATGAPTEPATDAQQTGRPSPSPISEDKSSGAEAPFDWEKKAWDDGAHLLIAVGKMSPPNARAFLGKLKAEHGITLRDLLPAIGTAMANGTQDPAAYLRRAASGVSDRKSGGSAAPPSPDEPINWTLRAAAWKRDGTWPGTWGPTPREKGCQCPKELLEA